MIYVIHKLDNYEDASLAPLIIIVSWCKKRAKSYDIFIIFSEKNANERGYY